MAETELDFELGDTVMDKITGFTGIITSYCVRMDGEPQYLVVSNTLDRGQPVECWLSESRLEETE